MKETDNHIPKIIHYCWFGGNPLPESAKKYIETWKKYCPDYEIVEWNESNFDLNYNDYVKEAYASKKWAFVSDVARLHALVNHGGIYMDTDVEVLRSLDEFLKHDAFSGFEKPDSIPTGIMACSKGHPMFAQLLSDYNGAHFIRPDGTLNFATNVDRITHRCLKHGLQLNNELQTVCGFTLYPTDWFCPKDYGTGKITVTENTHTIHHFSGTWHSDEERYARSLSHKFAGFMPVKAAYKVGKFCSHVKYHGFASAVKKVFGK